MATTLKITATSKRGGQPQGVGSTDDDGTPFIAAKSADVITLTLVVDPPGTPLANTVWKGPGNVDIGSDPTVDVTYDDDKKGMYTVTAKAEADTLNAKMDVRPEPAEATPKTPDPQTVVEVTPGVFDKEFSKATFRAICVAAALVLVAAAVLLLRIDLPGQKIAKPGERVYGTYAEGIAALVLVVVTAIGAILLLIGGWLGALETRGRLTVRVPTGEIAGAGRGVLIGDAVGTVLAKASDLVAKMSTARATVAVLVTGLMALVVAAVAAVVLANGSEPVAPARPTPGVSTTPPPSGSSSVPPSPPLTVPPSS